MEQTTLVMRYIAEHGSITALQAVMELGIMRLADVVHKLRKRGVPIVGHYVTGKNRFGQTCRYMRYSLK